MAQPWYYNHPFVDGHGNFGSVEGDPPAASRYIECRLSPITEDVLLSNLTSDTIDFIDNYDGTTKEPTVLPASLPTILINGTDGIAVGMASKMPTHNLGEVVDATIAILDNPKLTDEQIMQYLNGPDFATGGIIVNKSELPTIYSVGQGKIRVRGRVHVEDGDKGKKNLVVTEIPFTMIGAIDSFMDTVAELSRSKVMPDVTDIKNFSDKEGIRIIVELKKDADIDYNINVLYKKARLEDTFGYNATLLSNKIPAVMPITRILSEYLAFYRETLTRKYTALLAKETKAAEIKEGLIRAIDVIDAIIEVLRGSSKVDTAKKCLTKGIVTGIKFRTKAAEKSASKFNFTEAQADAILEMRLQKLIGLELDSLTKEYNVHKKNIAEYTALLNSKTKMSHKMRNDMLELKKKYAKPRKTELIDADAIVIKPQEVKAEKVWALVNRFGYIKLIDEATKMRNQASIVKDYKYCVEVMNTGTVYVFTENGKCHLIKAQNIPIGKYTDKGVPIETLCGLDKDDNAVAIISDINPKDKLLFVTKLGFVKLVPISEFVVSRKTIDATKLVNDTLLAVYIGIPTYMLNMVTTKGYAVSFSVDGISTMKKNSVGIMGIKLGNDDTVQIAVMSENSAIEIDGNLITIAGKRGSKGKLIT